MTMTTNTKSDIIEEYEKIKKAERDRISLRQDVDSKKILSADRVEDLLRFPIDSQENLRKTDRIYMTDDNKRLLLIRDNSSTTVSSFQKKANPTAKSEETILTSKSALTTKRSDDSDQDNGCVIDFKVLVDDNANQSRIHQIHVQANCPDFVVRHLYINGMKFSQEQ